MDGEQEKDKATPEAAVPDAAEAAGDAAAGAAPEPGREALLAETAELKERLLRAVAEQENQRRRHERDQAELRKYAVVEFARDLLAVYDNLNRALASVPVEQRQSLPEMATLLEGVELTERELAKVLEKHGVRPVEALGCKLDPNLHQAVLQVEDPSVDSGTVVQLLQPGFVIHDRLLRAAMVGVAKGRPAGEASARVDVQA